MRKNNFENQRITSRLATWFSLFMHPKSFTWYLRTHQILVIKYQNQPAITSTEWEPEII